MFGWLRKKLENGAQGKPLGSSGQAEITLTGSYEPQDGVVKIAGAFKAAQEAQQRGARGFLYVYEGPDTGATFFLERQTVSIGRHAPECEFALNDKLMSRKQCELRPVLGTFRLVDNGSKNGTYLNDQPVTEQDLVNGDRIAIGSSRIYIGIL
ncbi:MAG: FHA domain-containing protein [Proteobacteria bacterium]|nr:FHA domain-containing protein [Pseudomonadota bacterium]